MRKRKIGLFLIVILVFIIGGLTLIKVIRSSSDNLEELKVEINSTQEEAATHLSTIMKVSPKIEDTNKENLKYKWELINNTDERLNDGKAWTEKIINDGEEVEFFPWKVGFNKDAPITKTITLRLTVLEDGRKIGRDELLIDDHDGYYIIKR